MFVVESIIKKLGYSNSENLFRRSDFNKKLVGSSNFSHRSLRLLKELDPYASYCIEEKPFVLFFEQVHDKNTKKLLHNKIWNAQVPVAIFDCGSHIEIYNGYTLNRKEKELYLVQESNKEDLDDLSLFSYWNITNDYFWEDFHKDFSRPTLDTELLDNIKHLIRYLRQNPCKPFAVKLTLRLIFIRFLIDRGIDLNYKGILDKSMGVNEKFLSIVRSKEELYSLFDHLKEKFNGNLFEYYNGEKKFEMELLDEDVLSYIYHFLSGEIQLASGQLTLFPLYDFSIIPVELISNIYERLLGISKQKGDSAFYTPIHLVDYILDKTVKPFLTQKSTFTVLDPSCGSGIFLVESLRYLIENNLGEKEYFTDDQALVSLLTDNIYGVDKNSEAIEVAIFSLYLTLLDYKDPKSLESFKLPILKGSNFFANDFFSKAIDEQLNHIKFDFIIGNPPWGAVNDRLHLDYCIKHNIPQHYKEISRSFLARTKDFSTRNTQCCLIVTSKLFYNSQKKAKEFREWLLSNAAISRFIELAPVRNLIFENAKGPAAVLFYSFNELQIEENNIEHITIMPNLFFELFNIIVIETNDWKIVPQSLLLRDDWAWKVVTFGTKQDYLTIRKIKKSFKTMKSIIDKMGFSSGTGIQIGGGDKNDSTHLIGKRLLNAEKGLTPFNVDTAYSEKFKRETVHRTRKDREIFNPPAVLFKKGIDTKTFKLRAAYTEEEIIYSDTIYGIAGDEKEKDALLSFTGLLNSSFYAYLNLMLGSSAGIEREQAFPTVALSYPTIVNKVLSQKVQHIQNNNFNRKEKILQDNSIKASYDKLIKDLDEYILSSFNLKDNQFVRYALDIQIPLLTGDRKVHRQVNINDLETYVGKFIIYWNDVLENSNYFVRTTIYPSIIHRFSAIKVEFVEQKPSQQVDVKDNSDDFELISRFMLHKQNDLFYQQKNIMNFEEKSFYILKTNEYKNWHPAISEIDLGKVIDAVLGEGGDGHEKL